ncbi:MAG: hypothetical protein HFH03_06985 [Dorea sp.]|jgi:uncharacterized ferredoxin-like protein|nr:hypothetical protein [Dorea sp.]
MIYNSTEMEKEALFNTAARMCAAARTAPKAKGQDSIVAFTLTKTDKNRLADTMEEIGIQLFGEEKAAWYIRDAANVRDSQAVVLIGAKTDCRRIAHCGLCGFSDCDACQEAGGVCGHLLVDLGIAVSSAVNVAAHDNVDNRIMWSAGKAASNMEEFGDDIRWLGIPLSISGKNIFFDRH